MRTGARTCGLADGPGGANSLRAAEVSAEPKVSNGLVR
jgi:hypothetical protein